MSCHFVTLRSYLGYQPWMRLSYFTEDKESSLRICFIQEPQQRMGVSYHPIAYWKVVIKRGLRPVLYIHCQYMKPLDHFSL
jgi:hypothetical protein